MSDGVNLEDRMREGLIDFSDIRSFEGRDVLRIGDFNRDEITYVMEVARLIGAEHRRNRHDLRGFEFNDLLEGLVVGTNFAENSSRTHDSSWFAAENLGAHVVPVRRNAEGTSKAKGESIAHDMAALQSYGIHAVVMRNSLEGSPQWTADYLRELAASHPEDLFKPVIINGGDGSHEHPTQAFLDLLNLYTIYDVDFEGGSRKPYGELRRDDVLSGMTMLAVGDTLKGRTFKSLARALAQFEDNEVVIVSPEEVRSPEDAILDLKKRGLKVGAFDSIGEAIKYVNSRNRKSFVYGLRTQEERLDPKVFEKVKGLVNLTPGLLDMYEGTNILPIMHPLPMHKGHPEIHPSIDFRKEAVYFRQMGMGQFARMALLGLTLGRISTCADEEGRTYTDPRIRENGSRFVELDRPEHKDDRESMIMTLAEIVRSGEGIGCLRDYVGMMAESRDGKDDASLVDQYVELFAKLTDGGRALELLRHFTFRFREGEDGFVIDHIENGRTGLIKYHLDLSHQIGRKGCDGNPVVVSAVDGLDSKKYGLKGVIKMRGYEMPADDALQYCHLLSKTPVVVTMIKDGRPVRKFTPNKPYEIRDFIHCPNPLCVSRQEHSEHVPTVFYNVGGDDYQCRFCDTAVPRERFRLIKTD